MAQAMCIPLLSLLALAILHEISAVSYSVTNTAETTPGGQKFSNKIGSYYSRQILSSSTNFIWRLFQQNIETDRKNVQQVSLFIDDMDEVAYTSNDEIHVSARYIQDYSGDIKGKFTEVIYHKMTHVWQSSNETLGELIEGITDYVRLKAGHAPSHWVQLGEGDKWDHGYNVTAQFLKYYNSISNGFVAQLKKKMKDAYSADFFAQLISKTAD